MKNNRKHKTCIVLVSLLIGGAVLAQAPAPVSGSNQPPVTIVPPVPPPMPNPQPPPMTPVPPAPAPAPMAPPARRAPVERATQQKQQTANMRLTFKNSPLDVVLKDYGEKTGRTLLQAPNPAASSIKITIEGETPLTLDEYLQAIDTVLAMNQIALLKVGDKFLKVVPINTVRTEEMGIRDESLGLPKENGELVSQMIQLQYIDIKEAQEAIGKLQHPYAAFTGFERINSILFTDTAANVNRVLQIIKYIDQPIEAKEVPIIREIRFASAADIKKKLEEIILQSQSDAEKSTVPRARDSGSPGFTSTPAVPGVIRSTPAATAQKAQSGSSSDMIAQAEKGVIMGKVKIIADERTNILILITRRENMAFFDKIITVLDVVTTPDVQVKVMRLEYADAESVASTLNNLIGRPTANPKENAPAGAKTGTPGEEAKSAALNDYVRRLETEVAVTTKEKSKLGELSAANIKILPDKRTNAILIMASRADLAALEEMVKQMDIMLSQVMIEVVIFQISLQSESDRGVDLIQRALVTYEKNSSGDRNAEVAFAGVMGGDTARTSMKDPLTLTSLNGLSSSVGNLTYYFTFFNLNLDAIITLIKTDGRTQVLSSPQILTTDNKAASINVTSEKYFFQGLKPITTANGGVSYIDDVQMKKIGTKVEVTPHINEKKFVVMEIKQSLEEPGIDQSIPGQTGVEKWGTIDASEITANVAVRSGETIVLGGLVSNTKQNTESKVPILGDIPILGMLFKSTNNKLNRSETVVFITPYVLNTPEEIEAEATRIRNTVNTEGMWPKGWSNSKLAEDKNTGYAARRLEKRAAARAGKENRAAMSEQARMPLAGTNSPVQQVVEVDATGTHVTKAAEPAPAYSEVQTDPALSQFIERQEKRWDREVRDVDPIAAGSTPQKAVEQ